MAKEYVEERENGYYVAGSRVTLDSVVLAFLRGESPEGIGDSFPALTLEQIYGAIAFYLAHQEQVDSYLRAEKADFETLREKARRQHPLLYAKLQVAQVSVHKNL
jgi:uncharacterized protein (DUF433 family)